MTIIRLKEVYPQVKKNKENSQGYLLIIYNRKKEKKKERKKERKPDRQTDRQTDRQKERKKQTKKQTNKQTNKFSFGHLKT